eukprot:Trichotokara_eunicae@DN7555_c0_g1_i1.p1
MVWMTEPTQTANQVKARVLGGVSPNPEATATISGGVLNAYGALMSSIPPKDIMKCDEEDPCHWNALCSDKENGEKECTCFPGFVGDGWLFCDDINECLRPDTCAEGAACTNLPGSYECNCPPGNIGDGYESCRAPSVCDIVNPCHENATCAAGSAILPKCTCK